MTSYDPRHPDHDQALARVLLRSMADDAPSPNAKRTTLAALGLGATLATASASVTAATGASTVSLGKAALVGALVGLATMGTAALLHGFAQTDPPLPQANAGAALGHGRVRESPQASARTSPSAEAWRPAAPHGSRGMTAAEARPARTPQTRVAPEESIRDSAVGSPTTRKPPVQASSLPEETARLDRVRAALNAGHAANGLKELERYQMAFPNGALHPESTVLRIEALVLLGDRTRARELARSFMARYPHSPQVGRLRSLVGL